MLTKFAKAISWFTGLIAEEGYYVVYKKGTYFLITKYTLFGKTVDQTEVRVKDIAIKE